MKLPLRTAIAMYKEGFRLEAMERLEALHLHAVPMMKLQYFRKLKSHYENIIQKSSLIPQKPSGPALSLESTETRNLLIDLFRAAKRGPRV